MKKKLTLVSILAVCCLMVQAQQPSNAGFENWTLQTLYEEPDQFLTTGPYTYPIVPLGNVVKDTASAHGMYAATLTTITNGTDTIPGSIYLGLTLGGGLSGGYPYSERPDSISGYVKFNMQPNDTAYFLVVFKNSGTTIAFAGTTFTGVQSSYMRFSIPTGIFPFPAPAPDSMIAIISSSNINGLQIPGSTLTIDSITFIGATAGFPNPDFETWIADSHEEPDNWTTLNFSTMVNPSVTKTTDHYNGTYALRLETVPTGCCDTIGFITNGYLGNNGPQGGMAVFANPMKITGYYKYFPMGGPDTALAAGFSYQNTVKIDSSVLRLAPVNSYTYFEVPMNYNGFPMIDTFNIAFASSNLEDSGSYIGNGSALYIDDISVVYFPVGTGNEYSSAAHQLYPNPFSDIAILTFDNRHAVANDMVIYNVLGKEVMRKENITSSSLMIQRNNLAPGIYEYRVTEKQTGKISARGKLVIE